MINEKLEGMKQDYQAKLAQTEKKLTDNVGIFMDNKLKLYQPR